MSLLLRVLGLVRAMPADEAALLAGIRERLESALESLQERPPLEERPFLATAHRALAVLVHHLRSHCSRSILALWRRRGSSRRSSCSPNRSSRGTGTTSPPTCRTRRSRCCIPGTGEPVGPDDLAPLFPMELIGQEVSAGRRRSRSRRRSSTSTRSGARRRSTARGGSSRRSGRGRGSSTSTRASARRGATSRTPRSRRRTTTSRRAGRGSRPRPAPASGAARSRSPARSSGSSARSTWSGSRTSRSRSGAR